MGSNIIELAKLGHERAAELKGSYEAINACSLAQLISDLATQLEVQFVRSTNMAVQLANAESKCRELAAATPEGYVLVPQQIFLEPSDIESICSQCGDGHESGYGDFTDGLLWVGNIQRDDGSIVHGLHISSADYTEEGGVTVYEFAAQLRKGAAQ
ncbi:hypothetical protein [Salmonella enterica]|uniref:hypothetical protein n=1 Tax=Salmonella enterica TaxID=28901 RepID=UPI0038BB3EBB